MPTHTMTDIREFLALHRIAMPGVSRDPKDFSRYVFAELRAKGYDVVPVNPSAEKIDGIPCAHSVREITPPVEGALVMTPASRTPAVLEDCDAAAVRNIWLHRAVGPGSVSAGAVDYAHEHGMRMVAGECPLMFLRGASGIHRVHRTWRALTGQLPA